MRRILTLVLVLITGTLALTSCTPASSDRTYDERAVIAATAELVEKSALINQIFWGTGIPVSEDENAQKIGKYTEADPAFLKQNGIQSIEQLKEMTSLVYDSVFCKTIFTTKLGENDSNDDGKLTIVRYYQKKETVNGTVQATGPIMVQTDAVVYFEKPVVYHTDTLEIKQVKGEIIYLTLDVTVMDDADNPVVQQLTVAVIEESEGWRLINPTYDKYISPKKGA